MKNIHVASSSAKNIIILWYLPYTVQKFRHNPSRRISAQVAFGYTDYSHFFFLIDITITLFLLRVSARYLSAITKVLRRRLPIMRLVYPYTYLRVRSTIWKWKRNDKRYTGFILWRVVSYGFVNMFRFCVKVTLFSLKLVRAASCVFRAPKKTRTIFQPLRILTLYKFSMSDATSLSWTNKLCPPGIFFMMCLSIFSFSSTANPLSINIGGGVASKFVLENQT